MTTCLHVLATSAPLQHLQSQLELPSLSGFATYSSRAALTTNLSKPASLGPRPGEPASPGDVVRANSPPTASAAPTKIVRVTIVMPHSLPAIQASDCERAGHNHNLPAMGLINLQDLRLIGCGESAMVFLGSAKTRWSFLVVDQPHTKQNISALPCSTATHTHTHHTHTHTHTCQW